MQNIDKGNYPLYITTNKDPSLLAPFLSYFLQKVGYTPERAALVLKEAAPDFFPDDIIFADNSIFKTTFNFEIQKTHPTITGSLLSLYLLIKTLRSRCPWDKSLTPEGLLPLTWEEVSELWQSVKTGETPEIKEELGDVFLHILLHIAMLEEKKAFAEGVSGTAEVISGLTDKIVRRHPHVFAGERAENPAEAINTWERNKTREKNAITAKNNLLSLESEGGLSALVNAKRIQEIARKRGFDFKDAEDVFLKVEEELQELKGSLKEGGRVDKELGDLLFSIVNLSRHLNIDPEGALRDSTNKFKNRFKKMNEIVNDHGVVLNPYELDPLWEEIKNCEKEEQS